MSRKIKPKSPDAPGKPDSPADSGEPAPDRKAARAPAKKVAAKKTVTKKAAAKAPAAKKTVAAKAPAKPRAPRLQPLPRSAGTRARLKDDLWLNPWRDDLLRRAAKTAAMEMRLTGGKMTLTEFASGHIYYGLHRTAEGGWVFREWAPNATAVILCGDFSGWQEEENFACRRINVHGDWELHLPTEALTHGQHYRLMVKWAGGSGERIPAWATRVVQDPVTLIFSAQVWDPPAFKFKRKRPDTAKRPPLIYEAHIGMAQESGHVGTYDEFRELILPRIAAAGYNTVQIMGILEHPYYGSFGYHVSSFFAPSSRFGTPEQFKALVDAAHGLGLAVVIDLIHSHAVKNVNEGLALFDGSPWQYFHGGARGDHPAWDSKCFDYAKPAVLHFLLSNCRYWTEEFNLDGFRLDGVTSMLYLDHGLGKAFTAYSDYFHPGVDEDAIVYLTLANRIIHTANPKAMTIAEDVSGMPGLASPEEEDGVGFDYRLGMGVPDLWGRLGSDTRDEDWHVEQIYTELTNRRAEEQIITYVESHDQAIVGGKTFIFRLLGAAIYTDMALTTRNPHVDRGIALWKIARLLTLATASHGYLNFIGNEFGHPEWVDFPREGNGWSGHYARRQWSLRDNPDLKYHALGDFDAAIMALLGTPAFFAGLPQLLFSHVNHQLLVFRRDGLLFLTNLHPWNSPVDYPIPVPEGKWQLVLDTDETRFDGLARLRPGQEYQSRAVNGGHEILVYLPARSTLVLRATP